MTQRAILKHCLRAERRLDRSEPCTRFDVLVKTVEAFKWETLPLAPWPFRRGGFPLPASLNKTDGRKAAREKGEVTQTDEDTQEAASGMGEDAVSEPADAAFGVRGRRAVLPSFRSPLATIPSAPSGNVAPERRTCTSRVLGHQVMAAGIA
jgi:hypothetical protein